jgi:uncharacterized protein YegL
VNVTSDQIPFDNSEASPEGIFAENPEPRCPCVLVLDKSGSMRGAPIAELNQGLVAFRDELTADSLAAKRVEVAIVSFGPVTVDNGFIAVDQFAPPRLEASADTPMGAAIERALDLLDERKEIYRRNGVSYYRPWVFLITDGAPTDAWTRAASRVREGEAKHSFVFFSVGVDGANLETLAQISTRSPVMLSGLRFRELFQWLSKSLKSVSHSVPGDKVPLPAITGWNEI